MSPLLGESRDQVMTGLTQSGVGNKEPRCKDPVFFFILNHIKTVNRLASDGLVIWVWQLRLGNKSIAPLWLALQLFVSVTPKKEKQTTKGGSAERIP